MESNILEERKRLFDDIKQGKSVNRKELQDKCKYWLEQQSIWIEKDRKKSTEITNEMIFKCGCKHCTYRMALELLDKLKEENPVVKIVQEQDEIGQYKFDF